MTVTIYDDSPITNETAVKVRDIFRESLCPNESFVSTFGKGTHYDGSAVYLKGATGVFARTIEVNASPPCSSE